MSAIDSIRELSEPLLAGAGLTLWDVEVGRGVVRILVDRDEGVDLDTLTQASRALSGLFDDHPEVAPAEAYQLEVSSPGVERTLRSVEQYRRYLGELVSIKLTRPLDGQRRWRGRLVSVDDEGVALAPEGGSGPVPKDAAGGYDDTVKLSYEQIERTRTVLEWGPTSSGLAREKGKSSGPASAKGSASKKGSASAKKGSASSKGSGRGQQKHANGAARWSDPRQPSRTGRGARAGADVKETS